MRKAILAATVSSFILLSACGGAEKEAEKPQPDDRNEVTLKGEEAQLPEGMPKMPGMRLDRSDAYDFDNKSRRRLSTKFFVKDADSEKIINFYADEMEKQGRKVKRSHSDSHSNTRGENDAGWISVTSPKKPHNKAEEGETYAVMMADFEAPK